MIKGVNGDAITEDQININEVAASYAGDPLTWDVDGVDYSSLMKVLLVGGKVAVQKQPQPTNYIFLDGQDGNDDNNGASKTTAVKTFTKAKELLYQNKTEEARSVIMICGPVEPTDNEETWELQAAAAEGQYDNFIIQRAKDYKRPMVYVPSGKTLNLQNIVVDGGYMATTTKSSSAMVEVRGTLNIGKGATLRNNYNCNTHKKDPGTSAIGSISKDYEAEGGAVRIEWGTVNIGEGASIAGNTAVHGGGVFAGRCATLNMTGGIIANNTAKGTLVNGSSKSPAYGGGVFAGHGAVFNMSGGIVEENIVATAEGCGGGISLGDLSEFYVQTGYGVYVNDDFPRAGASFNMTGGEIRNNVSAAEGGGLYVQQNCLATVTAGKITGNESQSGTFGGGGIYVNGGKTQKLPNGRLNLTKVKVTENEAYSKGGGIAACKSGSVQVHLTNGGVILGNTGRDGYGSSADYDIYAATVTGYYGLGKIDISRYMLDGTPYQWRYVDPGNGTDSAKNGLVANQLVPAGYLQSHSSELSIYSGAASAPDDENFTVFITGNKARNNGGGIGTNGDVIIGEAPEKPEYITLNVTKVWNDNGYVGARPSIVRMIVQRSADGGATWQDDCAVAPKKDGNTPWKYPITDLPKTDETGKELQYRVVEEDIAGYQSVVTGNQVPDENNKVSFTVTNTPVTSLNISKTLDRFDAASGKATALFRVAGYANKAAYEAGNDPIYTNLIGMTFGPSAETADSVRTLSGIPVGYYVVEEIGVAGDNFTDDSTSEVHRHEVTAGSKGDFTVTFKFSNTYADEETFNDGVVNRYSQSKDADGNEIITVRPDELYNPTR